MSNEMYQWNEEMVEKASRLAALNAEIDGAEGDNNINIGSGIDVINASGPITSQLKPLLLTSDFYKNGVDVVSVQEAHASSVEADSFLETFTSMSIEAEIKAKTSLFTGGLSAKYGESRKLTSTAKFYCGMVDISIDKHSPKGMYSATSRLKKWLHPEVLEDINNDSISPRSLFGYYGTHLVKEATTGGAIQVTAICNSTEELQHHELKLAVDAACSYVSASGKTALTDEQKKVLGRSEIRAFSYGGDATLLSGLVNDIGQMTKLLELWGKSMKETRNQVLANILRYVPLWEFADGDKRRKELETGFYDLAKEAGKNVSEYITKDLPAKLGGLYARNGMNYVADVPLEEVKKRTTDANIIEKQSLATRLGSPGITDASRVRIIANDDKTYSFQLCRSGYYLKVNTFSADKIINYVNKDQLYFSSSNIGNSDREKFILEPIKPGSEIYKIKSKYNGNYLYRCEMRGFSSGSSICANQKFSSDQGKVPIEFELKYI